MILVLDELRANILVKIGKSLWTEAIGRLFRYHELFLRLISETVLGVSCTEYKSEVSHIINRIETYPELVAFLKAQNLNPDRFTRRLMHAI